MGERRRWTGVQEREMSPAPGKIIISGSVCEVRGGPEMERWRAWVVIDTRPPWAGRVVQGLEGVDDMVGLNIGRSCD